MIIRSFSMYIKQLRGTILPNIFKTASTPPEKPESEPFSKEPHHYQMGCKYIATRQRSRDPCRIFYDVKERERGSAKQPPS